MSTQEILIHANVALLRQGEELLDGIDDALYGKAEPLVSESAIGQHVRHVLDFYTCFLGQQGEARVDYDRRERDPRIETESAHAVSVLRRTREKLLALAGAKAPALALEVRADDATEDHSGPWSTSSTPRELQFLSSHTVHHFALIAVILRANGQSPPEGFGVAPSTLAYWKEQRACAP